MSATMGDGEYSGNLTGQCSGAFSGTDLGSGMIVSGCCTANIVVCDYCETDYGSSLIFGSERDHVLGCSRMVRQ